MSHIRNSKVASMLYEIADLLEMKDVQFKPRAYRRAAQNIESLSGDIETYYKEGKLGDIEGVGESIASKVEEIIETGDLEYLKDLREEFPEGLRKLMKVQGLGPKSIMKMYKNLQVTNLEELEEAANAGKIRQLEGFGEKSEKNILEGIKMFKKFQKRFLLGYILPVAKEIKRKLQELDEVKKIDVAGSIRRRKETIGDVDILIVSDEAEKVMDFFTSLDEVERVVSKGSTKSTIITGENLQMDLRVVENSSFGSALQYFTGSKEHNIQVRKIALEHNWKLSEYGLFNKDDEKIAGESETDVYKALNLDYIVPELREDRGEIEAAQNHNLPNLITLDDIKGDLHVHTKWSEGSQTIEEMARACINLGYEYLAICDHSKTLQIAQGLTEEEIKEQIEEINSVNNEVESITILKGIEANIDAEGNLDVSNNILKELDFVVASVHSGFKKSEKENTERIINAMHNDHVTAIGHPTGRMLNKREGYDVNLTKIFETAVELGIFLELNSFPERLDLSDINCKKARDNNVKIVINTDSHHKDHLRYMELGVATARRGWLEPKNVLNTLSLKELKKELDL